jgi:tetratricopeptide (TPR) repeat protein
LTVARLLTASGRYDEARAAIDSATRYSTGTEADVVEHATLEIRAGNFATADGLLGTLAQTGNADRRSDALWFLGISLRAQGRLHEALAVADGGFRKADSAFTGTIATSRVAEAQVRFELGQYQRAASIFESLVVPPDTFSRASEGRSARQRVWVLSHAGSSLAAAGDTAALAALADTVEKWGRKSGFGRDHHLHEYLRGLLWTARRRPDSALTAFSRATFSETQGFSRIDLQRARTLLSLGRPREAIPILRHPLSGPLEAGNFYTTPTELQELLAQAYDAAGEVDSAAVYYRYVVTAWGDADRELQPRVVRDRERLAADERRLRSRRAPATVALSP